MREFNVPVASVHANGPGGGYKPAGAQLDQIRAAVSRPTCMHPTNQNLGAFAGARREPAHRPNQASRLPTEASAAVGWDPLASGCSA